MFNLIQLFNYDKLIYHLSPLLAIIGYINYPQNLRINKNLLYSISLIHNGSLIIFSGWTFISLLNILHNEGIVFQTNYYLSNPFFNKLIFYFYLSKYYEFFDTFLLYLNGKTPIFLQKFHHIGAVICWHLAYVYQLDYIWIATLVNSFVHTIMYSYYLGCLLKIRQVRFIKQYITFLQLVQLIVPNCIVLFYYYPPAETNFNYNIILLSTFYIAGLVILFGQFYYKNYIQNKIE
jgi:hypothetical protein